jgi:hypothetical protein
MRKFFLVLFFKVSCMVAISQHNFDSIEICQNSKNELKQIRIGEYSIGFSHMRIDSIFSVDHVISYSALNNQLCIKHTGKMAAATITLTDEGVNISTGDTSLTVLRQFSVGISPETENIIVSLQPFLFDINFKNGMVNSISSVGTGKYIRVNIRSFGNKYEWDILFESLNNSNRVILTSNSGQPYLLAIRDDKNKVGIRLLSKKKNGTFRHIQGLKLFELDRFAIDEHNELEYSKKGRMKNQNSQFTFRCN